MSPSATKSMICRTSKTATMMKDTPLLAEKSTQPLTMQYSKLFRETNWLSWNTNCWREPTQGPVFLLWMPQKCKSAKRKRKKCKSAKRRRRIRKMPQHSRGQASCAAGEGCSGLWVEICESSGSTLPTPYAPLSYPPVSNPFLTRPFPAHSGYL